MTETTSKFRRLSGAARAVERTLLSALTLTGAAWATQIHHRLPWAFFNERFLGLFLGLALAAALVAWERAARVTAASASVTAGSG